MSVLLIGDIGGQLGLCLGASILTVFEFLEFLLLLVKRAWHKCTNRQRRKPKISDSGKKKEESDYTISAGFRENLYHIQGHV